MDLLSDYLGGYRYFGIWYNRRGDSKYKYGDQFKTYSKDETLNFLEKYAGVENCGISISTYLDGMPFLLFLPFDFDSEDIEKSWSDALRVYNLFALSGYSTILTFSGNKGFHVLVKTKPDIYTSNELREVQIFIKDIMNLKTCDRQIMGDIRRLIRIPGTYHSNGKLCEILKFSEGSKELDLRKFTLIYNNLVLEVRYENGRSPEKIYRDDVETPDDLSYYHIYPCIEKLVKDKEYWYKHHERHQFEPHWIIRFAFVISRLANGKGIDEIVDEIRSFGWDDFDEYKTEYFVRHIKEHNYKHPSCNTLKLLGFCLDNCIYNKEWKIKKLSQEDKVEGI